MKWALVDENNMVKNIIVYDGVSEYIPAAGLSLVEINDWIEIEDNADKLEGI